MDIDINDITGDIDSDDSERIFAMSDLSMIAIHDRFLQCSVLDRTAIDIDFAVFVWSEGECSIADDTIDDDIVVVVIDAIELMWSIFFESLEDSGLHITGSW